MKYLSRKVFLLVLCTVFSLICIHSISNISKDGVTILTLGSFVLPIVSLQGIIAAFNSLCCILLVFIDFKHGSRIAFTLMGISIGLAVIPIFTMHTLAPLPGIITNIVSLVSIIVIYTFYKKSALNSLTDYITGLPNRRYYVREMNARLSAKQNFYLACIEIEDYKNINDVYGIQAGDFILKDTAIKLKSIIGKMKCFLRLPAAFLR